MWVALYNGFPMVESDSGSYIGSAIINDIPRDRTPFYGYFIRYSNMRTSLWYSMVIQCLIVALSVKAFIRLVAGNQLPERMVLATVGVIVAFTAVSWVSAFLMPDIFGGVLLLLLLLYLQKTESLMQHAAMLTIIFFVVSIHNSHFLIVCTFAFIILLWSTIKKHTIYIKKSLALIITSLSFYVLMCGINSAVGRGFVFAPASHVFMMTKLAETGILKTYLDENCEQKHLKACAYKDEIPPVSWDYLWAPYSPLYKLGGWDSTHAENDIIIHDVFTTPKYLVRFAEKSLSYSLQQFAAINVPEQFACLTENSSPYGNIRDHYPYELNEYRRSKQSTHELSSSGCNLLYMSFFALSSLFILLLYPSIVTPEVKRIYTLILIFLFVNAFVTATFSTVIYRFQYRVFWVLPATNAILLIKWLYFRVSSKEHSSGLPA